MKSISAQAVAINLMWPTFKLIGSDADSASWTGTLSPVKRSYRVHVSYRLPKAVENFGLFDVQPRVHVLRPELERHPNYELGPIPHVYWYQDRSKQPVLCLFSIQQREWDPSDLIAETTIPWAASWLLFYEGWLATKKWKGGGEHAEKNVA